MLTYIEPCGWCSSSISSSYCPSNVNKYPNLSSSSSSISTSDSLSISTNQSISSSRRTSTYLTRASCLHPNDYYTSKRIDELHERMDEIQISSFLKFINHHLSLNKPNENLCINDLVKDLSNGHVLIDLIEILSATKLKREHGRTRFHSLTNVQYVLDYLRTHMQHLNISPHEIVQGNRKQILALLWMIMKIFNFPDFQLKKKNCFVENTLLGYGQDRSVILKWLNSILSHGLNSPQITIENFSLQTWTDGYYLSLILKYLIPISSQYLTLKCFDYLKELNSSNSQRFRICLNLSNYCFNTITTIDYTDRSDKCLFKYFTELQVNVLAILKSNQVGKLIQNNPYTKQILETIEHSSHVKNDNEQYLVSSNDKKQSTLNSTDHLSRIRTVEKTRLFNEEQQKMIMKRKNRWENIDNMSSNRHAINDQVEPEPSKAFVDDLSILKQQVTPENTENQLDEVLQQYVDSNEDAEQKQLLSSNEQVEIEPFEQTINENKPSDDIDEHHESSIKLLDEQSTNIIELLEPIIIENLESSIKELVPSKEELTNGIEEQNQAPSSSEKIEPFEEKITEENPLNDINEKLESSIEEALSSEDDDESDTSEPMLEPVKEIEQLIAAIKEQKQVLLANENIEPLEKTELTIIDNKSSIDINAEEKDTFTNEQHLETPSLITTNEEHEPIATTVVHNGTTSTPNGESKPLNQSSIPRSTSEQPSNVTFDKKPEQSTITVVENDLVAASSTTNAKKLEKPAVTESKHRIVSNGQTNRSIAANKKATVNAKNSVPMASSYRENQHSAASNEPPTRSTMVIKEPVQTATPPTITTTRNSKYSDIVSNQTLKPTNESVQGAASLKKQEQSTVSKNKTASNEKSKLVLKITEESLSVPPINTKKDSVKQEDQSIIVVQESPVSVITSEEPKKSTNKNKKSRRSNAKKGKVNNASVKTGISPQQPIVNTIEEEEAETSLPTLTPSAIPQEQKPQKIQSEIENSSSSNHANPPVTSSVTRSRRSKKKKTVATTTTTCVNKSPSSPSLPLSTAPHRNLLVIIKESIQDRKITALKCVVILLCLCFSIILLVLSHK